MIHHMKLQPDPFESISKGKKVIESRLFDEKRREIDIGDQIEFSLIDNPSVKVTTSVVALYRYGLFEELFSDFPPEYFGGFSRETLLNQIKSYYSNEDVKKYGVVGIRVKLDN